MRSIVEKKSFQFAIRIVNLYKHLTGEHGEYVMAKQVLRSGTSIGANVAESQQAQSRADFRAKLSIALKEEAETEFWLRLLHETDYLKDTEFSELYQDCRELGKLLTAILKTLNE
jgi:four helix bundle protein